MPDVTIEPWMRAAAFKLEHDLSPLEDGYIYFWDTGGAVSAWQLRAIADELDRRNAEWDSQLKSALAGESR